MSEPAKRPRILFLAQRVPYPPDRGDKITTWRLIERLARNYDVTVAAFTHDADDCAAAKTLEEKGFRMLTQPIGASSSRARRTLWPLASGQPLTLGYYGSRALGRAIAREVESCDLAYAYSSSMGAFLRPHGQLPRVMHFAELDSDKWRQYAEREPFPKSWVFAREARTLLTFEREIANSFDESVLCTPLEQRIFEREIPGASSIVIRNGVDLQQLTPIPETREPDALAFVGVMDYLPNTDGVRWFCDEILPRIQEQRPGARLAIIGSRPTEEVLRLGEREGVRVTGYVDDPKDELAKASVSIAPLRIARGIQNKVLEAMAMGLPVVGTTSATQGVEATPGEHFLLADEAREFAEHVIRLLEAPDEALRLGAASRTFVEQNYDWERVLVPFDELIQKLLDGAAPNEPVTTST